MKEAYKKLKDLLSRQKQEEAVFQELAAPDFNGPRDLINRKTKEVEEQAAKALAVPDFPFGPPPRYPDTSKYRQDAEGHILGLRSNVSLHPDSPPGQPTDHPPGLPDLDPTFGLGPTGPTRKRTVIYTSDEGLDDIEVSFTFTEKYVMEDGPINQIARSTVPGHIRAAPVVYDADHQNGLGAAWIVTEGASVNETLIWTPGSAMTIPSQIDLNMFQVLLFFDTPDYFYALSDPFQFTQEFEVGLMRPVVPMGAYANHHRYDLAFFDERRTG